MPVNQPAAPRPIGAAANLSAVLVPGYMSAIRTTGFSAEGDGGAALYKRVGSIPSHPAYLQDNSGAYFEMVPGERGINVKALGAKSDGSTVNDAAFDNAQAAAKMLGVAVYVPAAVGRYVIHASRNMFSPATTGTVGYAMIGDGPALSIIDVSAFSENYPVLDYSGNTGGVLRGIQVVSTSNANQCCCIVLVGQNATYQTGNNVLVEDCVFNFSQSSYNANNKYVVVVVNSDLSVFKNVTANGPGGWYSAGTLPAGVQSKFCTPNTGVDCTKITLRDCIGVGAIRPAWTFGDYTSVHADGSCYFAIINNGGTPSSSLFEAISLASIQWFDVRCENQSGTTGISVFKIDADQRGWNAVGCAFNTDSSGFLFTGAHTISGNFSIETSSSTALFASGVTYKGVAIYTNTFANLGSPSASSFGLRLNGLPAVTFSSMQAASPKHLDLLRSDGTHTRTADAYVQHRGVATNMREVALLTPPTAPSVTAYTGGSGEQAVMTYTLPANILANNQDLGGINTNGVKVEIYSETTSTHVVSGSRIRVNLSDGTHNIDLFDSNNKALSTAGFAGVKFVFDLYNLSSGVSGLRAQTEATVQGAYYWNRFSLQGASIDGTQPLVLTVYVTNTGNSPWNATALRALWL